MVHFSSGLGNTLWTPLKNPPNPLYKGELFFNGDYWFSPFERGIPGREPCPDFEFNSGLLAVERSWKGGSKAAEYITPQILMVGTSGTLVLLKLLARREFVV
jgi:hypothetical protein